MADMQLNMRVSEEVAERFRAFCKEQGVSQPQGMDSLLSMMELVQAKETLPTRQTEIEGFKMHIKAVMDAFLYSLSVNSEAEERVKQQFVGALESKDKTIISLQEKTEALQTMIAEAQAAEQESQNRAAAAEKEATAANEAAAAAGTAAADKAAIVDMLTAKLNEAEGKLGSFDTIRAEAQAAQEQVKQLQGQLKEAEYTHKAALMEVEYKAAQDKAAAQEQAAKEREQLERNHAAEVKELYEKMSVYQDQIATLTKNQIEKKEKPQRKSKVTAKSTAQEKGGVLI